jgi:hypothetical protein
VQTLEAEERNFQGQVTSLLESKVRCNMYFFPILSLPPVSGLWWSHVHPLALCTHLLYHQIQDAVSSLPEGETADFDEVKELVSVGTNGCMHTSWLFGSCVVAVVIVVMCTQAFNTASREALGVLADTRETLLAIQTTHGAAVLTMVQAAEEEFHESRNTRSSWR